MPIDLYYSAMSPPARVALTVAKIVGVEVNLKSVDFQKGEHKQPEYLKLNPNHTIPLLVDNGFPVFESAAIATYLVNKYKPGHEIYPVDPQKRAKVDEALHFFGSAFGPAMRAILYPKFFKKQEPTQEAIDNLKEKIDVALRMLGDKKFLTGDTMTIADIAFAHSIPALSYVQDNFTPSALTQYLERVKQTSPQFKAVLDSVPPLPTK